MKHKPGTEVMIRAMVFHPGNLRGGFTRNLRLFAGDTGTIIKKVGPGIYKVKSHVSNNIIVCFEDEFMVVKE